MAMITCVDERHHISTCNPEGMQRVEGSSRVANFILWWFFFQRGGFLHSADAQGLNDISGGAFLRIRLLFLQHFTPSRGPHQARPGEPASPKGSFCTVLLGVWFTGTAQRAATRPSPSGKGDRHRRWMRRGTTFRIVGTVGAEVQPISETVGNGLCAVPETLQL